MMRYNPDHEGSAVIDLPDTFDGVCRAVLEYAQQFHSPVATWIRGEVIRDRDGQLLSLERWHRIDLINAQSMTLTITLEGALVTEQIAVRPAYGYTGKLLIAKE